MGLVYSMLMLKLNDLNDTFLIVFKAVMVFFSIAASCGFVAMLIKLSDLQKSIEHLHLKSLAKYKHMFNAIQESIMVLTNEKFSFLNRQAIDLLEGLSQD